LACVIWLVIWRMSGDDNSRMVNPSNLYLLWWQTFVDFMLNQVSFQLGKVPVEIICDKQNKMIEKIPQISDLEIPKSLKHAKQSELWDWWKKVCLEELNSLKELNVWEVLEEDPQLKISGSHWVLAVWNYSEG
ncbi:uncharacterized protein VP01_8322g1, partial [Puccinia sorghi]